MIVSMLLMAAVAVQSPEASLEAQLPGIFGKCAVNYRVLEAAARPLEKGEKGLDRLPHGWSKWRTGRDELDMRGATGWTAGHFPGSLWYLYEATGDEDFRNKALYWTEKLATNAWVDTNHDVGFIMYCSYGNARRLLKTTKYDALLAQTAASLSRRYHEKLGLIRSWGKITDTGDFRVIPDNMMNLELLEWAAKYAEGGAKYNAIACSHADQTAKHHFRSDNSVYHVLDYDQVTRRVKGVLRGQGASTETAWSRGQSWAVYGYTMMYRETGFVRYLEQAKKAADFCLDHPNMPADGIPYWDYGAPGEERDSSAGSVLASALLELSQYVSPAEGGRYRAFAVRELLSLSSDAYFAAPDEIGGFILKHGVGNKPKGSEVDTPLDYGDYYYLEALLRFRKLVEKEHARAKVAAQLPTAGLPGKDDAAWAVVRTDSAAVKAIAAAEEMLAQPIAELPKSLYWEFTENGNRSRYENKYFSRMEQLTTLTVAEKLEGKGRFLERIDRLANAICDQPAWTVPAHDREHTCYYDTMRIVDLFGSEMACHLAYTICWVGERLPEKTVARVKAECERRIFSPLRRAYACIGEDGQYPAAGYQCGNRWVCRESNWCAVCHDNVTMAALQFIDDPLDRALFVEMAMRQMSTYARSFTSDGYCSEGMGYWNYGFGHYLMLGLTLRDLTDGKLDCFDIPVMRKVAEYALFYQLEPGHSPAFADGNGAPSAQNLALVGRVWPDLLSEQAIRSDEVVGKLFGAGRGPCKDRFVSLLAFGKGRQQAKRRRFELPKVTAYPEAQVWILRGGGDLAVAVKGGHNAELHNHCDVGSYYLVKDGRHIAGDPGNEEYTERTFSARRYDSKVLNSYGHPVPVVGGKLQFVGREAAAKVVKTEFSDRCDTIVIDLTAAYRCPTLVSLVRTFVFDREEDEFKVTDRVKFSAPTSFEDAYTLFEKGEKVKGKRVKGEGVRVLVDGATYTIREEQIENPGRKSPRRFGIVLDKPVTEAEIFMIFED